jgi:hypothetical protein
MSAPSSSHEPAAAELAPHEQAAAAVAARRAVIVTHAERLVRASGRTKYFDEALLHERLDRLVGELIMALRGGNLTPLLAYTAGLASDRFSAGHLLADVQVVFSRLEEAIWLQLCRDLPCDQHASALALVTGALSSAKDALAREYVALAAQLHSPILDLTRLSS